MPVPHRILFFTVQKAASMFLFEVARDLAALRSIPFHSPNADVPFTEAEMVDPESWREITGCVSPIRFFVPIPGLEQDRVILHLRDPRDVVTSLYYSIAYSHPFGGDLTMEMRVRWQEQGIDACVFEDFGGAPMFDWFGQRYREYLSALACRPNVTLLRYEDMVDDLPGWLRSVVRAFDFAGEEAIVAEMLNRHRGAVDVTDEDVMRHKRQIMPGDHRRRLRPETVAYLNAEFADILHELGYEV